jgi:carbohydrate diacid regulator
MSPPDTPHLSPRLRRLVAELREDSSHLSRHMLDVLRGSIPEYRSLNDSMSQDVYRVGLKNAELWYDALLSGGMPSDDDLRWIGRFIERRHDQAVSLVSVLQAYRVGTRVYLDALLTHVSKHRTLSSEVLFHVSPFLLCYSDLLGRTVSDAYLMQLGEQERSVERLHAQLCDAVLDPALDDSPRFADAARALGVDPDRPHVAIALRIALPKPGDPVLQVAARVAELLSGGVDPESELPSSMIVRDGHVLIWIPARPTERADERERRLQTQLQKLLKRCSLVKLGGIGTASVGAKGWRSSAEQAVSAIGLGLRLHPGEHVHRYSDFAFDTLVRQSREMSILCEELVERVAAEPVLLQTLEAYFEHRQNHKAVAAGLGIHRNTLMHRLGRIETLMGARLDDMTTLSRLHLGMRQRQLERGSSRPR